MTSVPGRRLLKRGKYAIMIEGFITYHNPPVDRRFSFSKTQPFYGCYSDAPSEDAQRDTAGILGPSP